jgi:putative transcriptional regulator
MTTQFRLRELMAQRARITGQPCTYETIRATTGISLNTLSTIANNKIKRVSVDVIDDLLNFFDCEPGDLMVRVR